MEAIAEKKLTRLGSYLKNKGISQSWLANKLGVRPATVNRYCWGEVELTPDKIARIAEILQVPNILVT